MPLTALVTNSRGNIRASLLATTVDFGWYSAAHWGVHHQAYFFAIGSSICFSFASLLFADVARKISPLWMNVFKAIVAWTCFAIATALWGDWASLGATQWIALIVSGILGLAIGDIFLLTAYARIGAARTLILYGFQPLFVAIAAKVLFDQDISWRVALAVVFCMACMFTFSLERMKRDGHWEIFGLLAALLGVLFDNSGLILSRWAFDQAPDMTAFQANLIRCSGALIFFLIFSSVKNLGLKAGWLRLGARGRGLAILASFLGTFMSLFLYLTAVKIGHLASISALAGAGPIFASAMECVYLRKWPSKYLMAALILFASAFAILTF